MAEVTRSSRLAIMEETTEGTPVAVSGATDFVALQDGFEINGENETIDNLELKGSIGATKKVVGVERSAFTMSHYLVHSGVEGQAPEYDLMLESLFGSETVQGTERTTTTGSSAGTASARAVVNLAAGGSDYSLGKAMLIKDTTNGYSIRNVYSVSTNALTLAQNLANAPATGVTCGKHVNYSPADTGHKSLSCWLYRSNGAAVELASGVKMAEGSIEITANENINMTFTGSGTNYYYNPIIITAGSNDALDFNDGGAQSITIPAGIYTPDNAASALQTAMDGVSSDNITVVYSDSTGKFTAASDGGTFTVDWATTTNTLGAAFGFTADDTGATSYVSDNALSLASPYTPSYDNAQPLVAKNMEVMFGGFNDITCFCAQSFTLNIANTKQDILCFCEETGIAGSLMTERAVTGNILFTLSKYDMDKFNRYKNSSETMITLNAGSKTGGNWDAGKCINVFLYRATLDTYIVGDTDGIVTISCDFSGYVENSEGEVYLNFL